MGTNLVSIAAKGQQLPKHVGKPGTSEFRVFFERSGETLPNRPVADTRLGKRISPWIDIPLYDQPSNTDLAKKEIINMVVEIPRG